MVTTVATGVTIRPKSTVSPGTWAVVARMARGPGFGPASASLTARPPASVFDTTGPTDPLPPATPQLTVTPGTPFPKGSKTRTRRGPANVSPGSWNWVSPVSATISAGAPGSAV